MYTRPATLRRVAFITPLLLAVAGWASLGLSAPALAATETRGVPEFQAITVAADVEVTVQQGSQQSLTLTAEDSVLALLEAVVEAGTDAPTLVLRYKRGANVYTPYKVRATVVVPRLSAVKVASSADVRLEAFNTPSLKLSVVGSGDIRAHGLTAEELQVSVAGSVAGSGGVHGSGSVRRLKVSVAGSGDVRLAELRADDVVVGIAGSGDVVVQAQATLDVSIVGSGDAQYSGAANVKQSVRGSGTIRQR